MTAFPDVDALHKHGHIGDLDQHFGIRLAELAGGDNELLALAASILGEHTRAGHTCIDLGAIAGKPWPGKPSPGKSGTDAGNLLLPCLEDWLAPLKESPAVALSPAASRPHSEEPAPSRPLVLDTAERLYLNRMWQREQLVAVRLRDLANREITETGKIDSALNELFENDPRTALPRQAAHIAASRHLCCISGGPGTGKTYTVAMIIMALMNTGQVKASDIAFAAPTGKAAARLQEATRKTLSDKYGDGSLPEDLAVEVSTIHRWLMKSEAERGLAQVLIIDEASMVDIHLMSRVLKALPDKARLILLGDSHQLASVDPGSVFADICGAAEGIHSPLRHCVINLEHNWRFSQDSGIGRLARAIKQGDSAATTSALDNPEDESIRFENLEGGASLDKLAERFTEEHYAPMVAKYQSLDGAGQISTAEEDHPFKGFMALCSHRVGGYGSQRFNLRVEQHLHSRGLISGREEFYIGRPIIVTRNDHRIGLANGDTGIVVNAGDGVAKVWFPDLREPNGEVRLVTPQRLPPHESFYALTVHRSQGSEYDEVAVIPGAADSRVNTRELLYTAVTRARQKVVIHGARAALKAATERKTSRGSGLKDALL